MKNFRAFEHERIHFERGTTTLVGENNVGKSSVLAAITALTQCLLGSPVQPFDYRRTNADLQIVLSLSGDNVPQLVRETFLNPQSNQAAVDNWLSAQGTTAEIVLSNNESTVTMGELHFTRNTVRALNGKQGDKLDWNNNLEFQSPQEFGLHLQTREWAVDINFPQLLGHLLAARLKMFQEVRLRSTVRDSVAVEEDMSGADTAGVLFNLKNHRSQEQRTRFDTIVSTFEQMYPQYRIEVVMSEPGSHIPQVQLLTKGKPLLELSQTSTGLHHMLNLLTNIIAREGLIIVIEHPESHLHPHAKRYLHRILNESSKNNQIIITTHDPHFIEAAHPESLRRVWLSSDEGSRISRVADLSSREAGQIGTALKDFATRDALFSRATILVEDESQAFFLRAIAPTLGCDLDAKSISVVAVNGENGYSPYRTLLDKLNIPYVGLRDRAWGQENEYPAEQFFYFGKEIEDYLDESGLRARRDQAIEEVGRSKPRVMMAMGSSLPAEEIPQLFHRLLASVSTRAEQGRVPEAP